MPLHFTLKKRKESKPNINSVQKSILNLNEENDLLVDSNCLKLYILTLKIKPQIRLVKLSYKLLEIKPCGLGSRIRDVCS